MSGISIFNADVRHEIKGKRKLYSWLKAVIVSEERVPGKLDIILCSDKYLLNINQRFLDHDYYTDIITFDYSEDNVISGELYISFDRVVENAQTYGVGAFEELHRVIVHGVLHLCGYRDKTDSDRRIMRQKENEKLVMLKNS